MLFTRIESRLCIIRSPSHEFIIIIFYNERAGLVALNIMALDLVISEEF